jgi:ComEC/Rec2-related protein
VADGIVIGLSLLAGVTLGGQAAFLLLPLAVLMSLVRGGNARRTLLVVLVCLGVGSLRSESISPPMRASDIHEIEAANAVVVSFPVASSDSERVLLRVAQIRGTDGTWMDVSDTVLAYMPEQQDGLSLGDRVKVTWDVTHVDRLPPGYGSYVQAQGASASAWVRSYEITDHGLAIFEPLAEGRRGISSALESALPGDAGALASGIVTGDDSALSTTAEDAFRETGTAHITAVSGQNVALLVGFLSLWLRPSTGVRRTVVHGLMLLAVWSYAIMVGLEPPALRAATVASLTILGAHTGRRPDPLTLLALTLGAMAMIDPHAPRMVGFWLSASASWALCTVVQPSVPQGARKFIVTLLLGPVVASIATLPILIATFHDWSPVAPLVNAILSPVMTVLFAVTYIFTVVAMLPGPWASLLGWIPGIGLDLAISIVERMASIAPQVHLDGAGPAGVVMIAIPCVVLLLAMSRDGERWMRLVGRAWANSGTPRHP